MDFPFWNVVLSNAVIATALAILALVIGRCFGRPRLEHFVWLLVLLKLFTPPLWNANISLPEAQRVVLQATAVEPVDEGASMMLTPSAEKASMISLSEMLGLLWLSGSAIVLTIYTYRSRRFARLIAGGDPASPALQAMAHELSCQLKLRQIPQIWTVEAAISPLLCWRKGQLAIVLPVRLMDRLCGDATQAILSHELAHVKRRDHFVRLLEALGTICFWWNPVAWLAQRRLQECGELCCDAHVMSRTSASPKPYAQALLETMDWLSGRPPCATWGATAATGNFNSMTRRFQMLQTVRTNSRSARILSLGLMALVTASLGFGVAVGQEQSPIPPLPVGDQKTDKPLWTMEFRISETDASGKTEVICSPKIITASDASLKTHGAKRQIEVHAKPVKASDPKQWKIEFKLTEQGKIVSAPTMIVMDTGWVEIRKANGEKLKFTVDVKPSDLMLSDLAHAPGK